MYEQHSKLVSYIDRGIRFDGRNLLDFRTIEIETGLIKTAEGSAKVKIGNTEHEIPVEKNLQEFYISFAKNFVAEKRNYRKEYDNYQGTEKQKKNRAKRNKVNRLMKRLGRIRKGDGRDVDHKDGNPNNNSMKNLRVVSKSHNRSKK